MGNKGSQGPQRPDPYVAPSQKISGVSISMGSKGSSRKRRGRGTNLVAGVGRGTGRGKGGVLGRD